MPRPHDATDRDAIQAAGVAPGRRRRIMAAAIQWKGIVFTGVRHAHIRRQITELGHVGHGESLDFECEGFIDSSGAFLTRVQARPVAEGAGQAPPSSDLLVSEDMW